MGENAYAPCGCMVDRWCGTADKWGCAQLSWAKRVIYHTQDADMRVLCCAGDHMVDFHLRQLPGLHRMLV